MKWSSFKWLLLKKELTHLQCLKHPLVTLHWLWANGADCTSVGYLSGKTNRGAEADGVSSCIYLLFYKNGNFLVKLGKWDIFPILCVEVSPLLIISWYIISYHIAMYRSTHNHWYHVSISSISITISIPNRISGVFNLLLQIYCALVT